VPTREITQATKKLQAFYAFAKQTFEAYFPDYVYKPTCVYRSPEEQLVEFNAGRSQRDGTKIIGAHNVIPARAFDGGIFRRSDGAYIDEIPSFPETQRRALYAFVGLLAEHEGLRWGGDWNGNGVPVAVDKLEHLDDDDHIEDRANG
jgi:hypothetical protein